MFNLTPTVRNLLLANLAFFLMQENLHAVPLTQLGSLYAFGSPYLHFWQFFTYMFLHASWGHLFSNMFGLVIFGPLLEQNWGGPRFLAFWLLCGVGAGVLYNGVRTYENHRMAQAAREFHELPSGGDFANFYETYFPGAQGYRTLAIDLERNPSNPNILASANEAVDAAVNEALNSPNAGMLGASGALFGLIFALAYLFPNTELFMLFIPFPVKAKYLALGYGMYELYGGLHRVPGDNVAHYAHISGMLVAFIILKFWERGRSRFY